MYQKSFILCFCQYRLFLRCCFPVAKIKKNSQDRTSKYSKSIRPADGFASVFMFIATDFLFVCKQHISIIPAIIFCYQRRRESNQIFSLYHGASGICRRRLSAFFEVNWISFAYFHWGCLPCLHTLIISLDSVMIF